jgi:hypothetical protein
MSYIDLIFYRRYGFLGIYGRRKYLQNYVVAARRCVVMGMKEWISKELEKLIKNKLSIPRFGEIQKLKV